MTIGFKELVKKTLGEDIDLSKGIIEGNLFNSFYNHRMTSFPYKSLRSMAKALEWPTSIDQTFEYPFAAAPGWTDELNGVTNDGKYWYITQKDRIWKFPLSFDLGQDIDIDEPPAGVLRNGIPSQYNYFFDDGYYFYDHMGDLDFYQGRLYVALEGDSMDMTEAFRDLPNPPPKIAVYDANSLAFISAADVLGHNSDIVSSCAWCAINPLNGLLYSSDSTPSNNTLRVYRHYISPNGQLDLNFDGYFPLSGTVLEQISGGVFSKNGHLYLVTTRAFFTPPIYDPETDTFIGRPVELDGIYGFDMINGRQILHEVVPYDPSYLEAEELEGITILDLDSAGAPFTEGQIHLIMLDNDVSADDLYFKHFKVAEKEKI